MRAPLYQVKAEFFKTLGHPARIRLLEVLSGGEMSVTELQVEVGLESSHLSQQLAVLRRAGLVAPRKQGTTVFYSLVSTEVADFLTAARGIISGVLAGRLRVLEQLQSTGTGSGKACGVAVASADGNPDARPDRRAPAEVLIGASNAGVPIDARDVRSQRDWR